MVPMEARPSRTGVWIVGAFGSLATTVIVGARAIAKGLTRSVGLVSDDPAFAGLPLCPLPGLEFGGHEIRKDSIASAGEAIARENGSLDSDWLRELQGELQALSQRVRPGTAVGGGRAIAELADDWPMEDRSARDCVNRLSSDIQRFQHDLKLDRVVVMNLASTEPPGMAMPARAELEAFERELDGAPPGSIRPGALYAYAAIQVGAAYVNFTPSASCLGPAIVQFAAKRHVPYMGNDGKTGETLVKSALAPLFRMRRLEVLSWVGYNVLGNRDGRVLATEENKASKLGSKDAVVPSILGYPVRTHVGIDFVESLGDSKVAWDFIHFRGFLEHPMSMQFTWQGCDSILAAPLVIDLARFADLALQRGESGAMEHLASFFKSPLGPVEHDLSRQYTRLTSYAAAATSK
jgi:myo-inositol-1-phosphate synthase